MLTTTGRPKHSSRSSKWSPAAAWAAPPNWLSPTKPVYAPQRDTGPPEAFRPFVEMVASGGLRDTLNVLLANKAVYRSQEALGPAYERPEKVTDEDIETYLRPFVRNDQRTLDLQRFVTSFDNKHTVSIAPKLRALRAPTLIVWATDDIYFPVRWACWLAGAIPGAKPPVELEGARLFFPEERASDFNRLLRDHLLNG